MTDRRLDEIAAAIEDGDLPTPPSIADIRGRARRRTARRHSLSGAAIVGVLVAVIAGAGLLTEDDPQLSTAAPPGTEIEKFDRVPDGIGTWEFRSAPAAVSRTGERSGFGLRQVTGSDDLLIYLTDGGLCVDRASCGVAASSFDAGDLEARFVDEDGGPLRSLISAGAPFARWNVAVVPGINGDLHAGSRRDVDIPEGPRNQQLVGRDNLGMLLAAVFERDAVPHQRVVLAGSGSAGLGALITLDDVGDAAGDLLIGVVVDGGALPRASELLPDCIVQRWSSVVGLSYPDDWDERVGPGEPTNLSGLYRYAADRYPDVEFVMVTSRDDAATRRLLRFGAGACTKRLPAVQSAAFGRGIDALEADLATIPGWSTVVIDTPVSTPVASADDLARLGDLDAILRELAGPSS